MLRDTTLPNFSMLGTGIRTTLTCTTVAAGVFCGITMLWHHQDSLDKRVNFPIVPLRGSHYINMLKKNLNRSLNKMDCDCLSCIAWLCGAVVSQLVERNCSVVYVAVLAPVMFSCRWSHRLFYFNIQAQVCIVKFTVKPVQYFMQKIVYFFNKKAVSHLQ